MKTPLLLPCLGLMVLGLTGRGADPATDGAPASAGRPYVYTEWQQFTKADGLPNEHIFAVTCHGSKVWIGTEGGLACYDRESGQMQAWTEKDGLPWRVVSGIAVHPKTGEVWLSLFGGGLARFSAGRFDHFTQLNSGLVNDVAYGVAIENDNVWVATTAGASRYDTIGDKWSIFTEKNSPMEEIWNYGVCTSEGRVYLAVWGSGILEYTVATGQWKAYLDPDGEMEIDLYRDDGIIHVITTGVSTVQGAMWVGTYFGACRYDGRHWRGWYANESGLPGDFVNAVKARSDQEAWFCTDRGVGAVMDFATDTWVTYTTDGVNHTGRAVIQRGKEVLETVETGFSLSHNYTLAVDFVGPEVWIGTSKGLCRGIGRDYRPGLKPLKPPARASAP